MNIRSTPHAERRRPSLRIGIGVRRTHIDDVDATYRVGAGATSFMAPTDKSWGDRCYGFVDPFDNR